MNQEISGRGFAKALCAFCFNTDAGDKEMGIGGWTRIYPNPVSLIPHPSNVGFLSKCVNPVLS